MGYLTTHVLDTSTGQPAKGMRIELFRLSGGRTRLADVTTNADGRVDGPILPEQAFETGEYELVFHAGDYFDSIGADLPQPKFLDVIPIRFGMAADDHYHVPLLVSPFGLGTYRGS